MISLIPESICCRMNDVVITIGASVATTMESTLIMAIGWELVVNEDDCVLIGSVLEMTTIVGIRDDGIPNVVPSDVFFEHDFFEVGSICLVRPEHNYMRS